MNSFNVISLSIDLQKQFDEFYNRKYQNYGSKLENARREFKKLTGREVYESQYERIFDHDLEWLANKHRLPYFACALHNRFKGFAPIVQSPARYFWFEDDLIELYKQYVKPDSLYTNTQWENTLTFKKNQWQWKTVRHYGKEKSTYLFTASCEEINSIVIKKYENEKFSYHVCNNGHKPALVYFIGVFNTSKKVPDAIKIGQSTEPQNRLNALQSACPFELRLLKSWSVDCSQFYERILLNTFNPFRMRGEWIRYNTALDIFLNKSDLQ